jgi:cardiolipin synthase
MLNTAWLAGHRYALYENGEQFFPAAYAAIASARQEVLLESFIWADDVVGCQLLNALTAAARRGVSVDVCVDGYGSPGVNARFVEPLVAAGGRVHLFDPQPAVLGLRTNMIRRLHRKLLVIDGESAFVGGINFEGEQLVQLSPRSKHDYAMSVHGPVVAEIRSVCLGFLHERPLPPRRQWWWSRWRRPKHRGSLPPDDAGQASFVLRDNHSHRTDIEVMYRAWLRAAQDEVILANAYFFPGYRLLRELRRAAQRGVRVRLILQGMPDMKSAQIAAGTLYEYLIASGVEVYEFLERPLHAKVAVVDRRWATVGSSNLDPLSLSLNLEANLFVADRTFAQALRARLVQMIDASCEPAASQNMQMPRWWRQIYRVVVFHMVRRFPVWMRSLTLRRRQRLQRVGAAHTQRTSAEPSIRRA